MISNKEPLWYLSQTCHCNRCDAGLELCLQLEKQTIRQLLSGLRERVLLRNCIGTFAQQSFTDTLLHFFLYRTHDLATELNFHLTEYQTGRLGKLDEVAEPSRQVRVSPYI